MDISIFLAKLIGVYLLIVTFLCVFRKRQVELTGKEVLRVLWLYLLNSV